MQDTETALALAALAEAVPVDPLLQGGQAVQEQSAAIECRAEEQGSGQVVESLEDKLCRTEERLCKLENRIGQLKDRCRSLEDKIDQFEGKLGGFEGLMENLRKEIEEKTRFFEEVEAYNEKLVTWSKDSKNAIDGLVAKLKEEVELTRLG
ncbi:hypothetical protein F5884DRAFT_810774 [Xylogone sp. PMI_703]|nr:hypothetical protein F5884DRAFT_810774 [Xylogone sp. PMI_703]